MFKFSFHLAINLLKYESLIDRTSHLQLIVNDPSSEECASHIY